MNFAMHYVILFDIKLLLQVRDDNVLVNYSNWNTLGLLKVACEYIKIDYMYGFIRVTYQPVQLASNEPNKAQLISYNGTHYENHITN